MISFHLIDVKRPRFNSRQFKSALKSLILQEGFNVGSINLILCSDEHLLSVNKEYLDHDYYTDIITFDYVDDKLVSGDLYISIDRVRDNASSLGLDFASEFARVCAHGVLHLCGYKDKSPKDEKLMRTMENKYLPFFSVSRET